MFVKSDIVFSDIVDSSTEEKQALDNFLYFPDQGLGKSHFEEERFYTGLIPFLQQHGFNFKIKESTEVLGDLNLKIYASILNQRVLRDYQISSVRKALRMKRGIVQLCTGAGKTEVAAATIAHLRGQGIKRAIVLVPTVFLMQQTYDRFKLFGITKMSRVGGGHRPRENADIFICVVNSALRCLRNGEGQFIRDAEILIMDEAHHAKSNSWVEVAEACEKAEVRLAFTATAFEDPFKWSYEDLRLVGLTGPVIQDIRSKVLRRRGYLAEPLVTMISYPWIPLEKNSWYPVYKHGIVDNHIRNSIIVSIADTLYENYYKSLIFVNELVHGNEIARVLSFLGHDVIFVHGRRGGSTVQIYKPSGSIKSENWPVSKVGKYVNECERCLIVSSTVMDEGVDFPAVNALIMGTGMKKYRRSVQRAGRGMRPKEDGGRVFMFDFFDECHRFLSNQSDYRYHTYEKEEFEITLSIQYTEEIMKCPLKIRYDLIEG